MKFKILTTFISKIFHIYEKKLILKINNNEIKKKMIIIEKKMMTENKIQPKKLIGLEKYNDWRDY